MILTSVFSGTLTAQGAGQQQSRTANSVLQDVSILLGEFKFDEAIALFDSINPAEAGTASIRLIRASVLNSAGRNAEAKLIAEAVSREEPNNLNALYVLSSVEGAAGRTREQRVLLERIIRADPDHVDALIDLGNIFLELRQNRNAALNFEKVLQLEPNNLEAILGRARVFRLERDPHGAESLYNKAVTLYPGQAEVWHNRGRLYRGMGFPEHAINDLDRAKQLDPYSYWISIDRGSVLLDMNMKLEALEEYHRAINLEPNMFLAYAYTAGIKDEFGDLDGAARDYSSLTKLNPEYPYGFEGLGFHEMRQGNWSEAKDAFIEAHRLLPNEWYYGLLAAINWMRAADQTAPSQYLNQAMNRQTRDSIEFHLYRLFLDLSRRVTSGENDMLRRIDQEPNPQIKARLLFYLGHYFDIRGNKNLADRYFLQFKELNQQSLLEWRLNEWMLESRGSTPY